MINFDRKMINHIIIFIVIVMILIGVGIAIYYQVRNTDNYENNLMKDININKKYEKLLIDYNNLKKYVKEDSSKSTNLPYGDITISINNDDLAKIGKDKWSDPVQITIDGKTYTCTMKVRGFSSGFQNKKPYNLKFKDKVSFYNLGSSKEWALVGEFYDMTFIQNQLTYQLGSEMGLPSPPWMQVVFNTTDNNTKTYHGLYSLTKKFTAKTVDSNVDAIIEFDRPDPSSNLITPSDPFCNSAPIVFDYNKDNYSSVQNVIDKYGPMYRSILTTDISNLKNILDYDSFALYFIISELADSIDGYLVSTYTYVKNGKIHMGFLWDYNMAYGNYFDISSGSVESPFWSCRSPQLYDKWRYYESNRFAVSSTANDPTNINNYNNSQNPDQNMIRLRGNNNGSPDKDPNNFISFSRNCKEGNVITNWYVRLLNDQSFVSLISQKYKNLRQTTLSLNNIVTLINQYSDVLIKYNLAVPDIKKWYNENTTPNATKWNNPVQSDDVTLSYYKDTVQYLIKWITKRLEFMDSTILIDKPNLPNDTKNLNTWNDYNIECNKMPNWN